MATYDNTNTHYIANDANNVYAGKVVSGLLPNQNIWAQETGWHLIPNNLFGNFMTPKQWFDLVSNHSSFRIASIKIIVQNLIPLTDNLSIAQDTTFVSFNNTIYALSYQDNNYETNFTENIINLAFREGVIFTQNGQVPGIGGIVGLPKYTHYLPCNNESKPLAVYAWDPFIHAGDMSELRPGKNAVEYGWSRHASDDDNWCSTAALYEFQHTGDVSNKPNYSNVAGFDLSQVWLTPCNKMKEYPINYNPYWKKASLLWKRHFHFPIPNMFIKMMPIYGTNSQQLRHTAQIVVHRSITFDVVHKKNTTNFPQIDYHFLDVNQVYGDLNATPFTGYTRKLAYRPMERNSMPPEFNLDSENPPYEVVNTEGENEIKEDLIEKKTILKGKLPVNVTSKPVKSRMKPY